MTGRECGETQERAGWAHMGSSWSSGGIFQWLGGSPLEVCDLNPKVVSPAYSTSAGKEPRYFCSHLPWSQAEGGKSGLEILEESLGLVVLRRELKEQPPGSPCWVIPNTAEATFLRQGTPLQVASWGEARALWAGITLPYPVELKLVSWSVVKVIKLVTGLINKLD